MGVYPISPLPVFVHIAPGVVAADPSAGPWVDVTTSVDQVTDKINIDFGVGDWGAETDAGTCALTFNNPSGDYSEHNPNGQWYGLLGPDTPLRVGLRRVEDLFARTSSSGWGTSESGPVWQGFGAGGSVLTTDFTISGGLARQSVPAVSAYRASWLPDVQLLDCRVRLSGVSLPFSDVTGGSVEPGNILLRMRDLGTYYLCRVEITTTESVVCRIYNPSGVQIGSAVVAGLTHSSAQTLEVIAEVTGDVIRMMVWPTAGPPPTAWTLSVTDSSLSLPGGVGLRTGVAAGNTNTLPIVASYDSVTVYADLFGGTVPAWVPRHDLSGKIRKVPVVARGTLARWQPASGTLPAYTPFRRTITAAPNVSKLLAYWPCEDGEQATQAASGLPGGTPMRSTGTAAVAFATDPEAAGGSGFKVNMTQLGFNDLVPPGTADLPSFAAGGRLAGKVPAGVSSPTQWAVGFVARSNALQAGKDITLIEWETSGGTFRTWRLRQKTAGGTELLGTDAAGTVFSLGSTFNDQFKLADYRIEADTSGADTFVRLYIAGVIEFNNVYPGSTLGRITDIRVNPDRTSVTGVTGLFVGHVQVWDTGAPPTLGLSDIITPAVVDGYGQPLWPFWRHMNEGAPDRLKRVTAQDGVGVYVPPVDAGAVTRMGPQPDANTLDLVRETVRTDGGLLYERPFGLGFVPRGLLYSQPPALTIDAGAGQLAAPPAPDEAGQGFRNRWEVSRPGGSSAVAQSTAGGAVFGGQTEANLSTDGPLFDHASWRLHLANGRGLRWPTLALDMWAAPALMDAWLNCRVGSRILVSNPPADVADADIDVLLLGGSITLGHKSMAITANCAPARPWNVAKVGAGNGFRPNHDASMVAEPAAAGATALTVSSAGGNVWTTTAQFPADFPFDVNVSGERKTVTAIASLVLDAFGRTSASTWTNADSGQPWANSGGAASDHTVSAGTARQSISARNVPFSDTLTAMACRDWDLYATVTFPVVPTGAAGEVGMRVRYVDSQNFVDMRLFLTTGNTMQIIVRQVVAGVETFGAFVTLPAMTATSTARIHLQAMGSVLRAKAFPVANPEPVEWLDAITTTFLAAGGLQLYAMVPSSNTNVLPLVVQWDNVESVTPQRFTVTPGVNGILKASAAGAPVRLWTPTVVGL